MDSHKRSIAKTISWRIVATTTTIAAVFIFTGNLTLSIGVGAVEMIAKLIFYYLHERAWNRVKWGRKTNRR
jgi:uncharacterized membrane protein